METEKFLSYKAFDSNGHVSESQKCLDPILGRRLSRRIVVCGLLFDASYAVFSFCCIVGGVIGYSIESSVSDK